MATQCWKYNDDDGGGCGGELLLSRSYTGWKHEAMERCRGEWAYMTCRATAHKAVKMARETIKQEDWADH